MPILYTRHRLIKLIACLVLASISNAHAAGRYSLTVSPETQIDYKVSAAKGNDLFIWLPSEAGPQANDATLAQALARHGIEVWRVDLLEAHFLPTVESSLDQIPADDMRALIDHAYRTTHKRVFVVTTGRGAIPVLRGAQQWQQHHPQETYLGGIILIGPKFYVETPDPGEAGEIMPIVEASNLPIFILQADQSPWYWKLPQTIAALEKNGSDVFVQRLKNVRDRFDFRPEATESERALTRKMPQLLLDALKLLESLPQQARQAVAVTKPTPPVRMGKKDRTLQTYKGNPTPPALALPQLSGKPLDLAQLRGKVVLVNFWATWCPPCVFEMPSMQRLSDHFKGQAFTILAVNMAEDDVAVQRFLSAKVHVNFPIVLDKDGAALKRWGVFAFPTTYVVDKKGDIRYALFGGLEWDSPEIKQKIAALLGE